MHIFAAAILACALTAGATTASAQAYKCKTPSGTIAYSDRPCETGQTGGTIQLRDNSIDTSAARNAHARTLQRAEQRREQGQMRSMAAAPVNGPSQSVPEPPSYACKKAINNANTQSTSAPPSKIDADRGEARRVCGFDPWPGPSASEIDAANRRSRAIERQARAAEAAAAADSGPASITNCDAGGCWDTKGKRYNGDGQTMFRSDGKTCTRLGNMLNCS
jgi:hypothetical protein